jgi:hypothetical protein
LEIQDFGKEPQMGGTALDENSGNSSSMIRIKLFELKGSLGSSLYWSYATKNENGR